jgi:hypothetical protein
MKELTMCRAGEDYVHFVEQGLFQEFVALFPRFRREIPASLVTVVGQFPLPDCCAPLVAMLNKRACGQDSWLVTDALTVLTSLVYSRGLDLLHFIRFTEICSFALVLVQRTANYSFPLAVIQQLSPCLMTNPPTSVMQRCTASALCYGAAHQQRAPPFSGCCLKVTAHQFLLPSSVTVSVLLQVVLSGETLPVVRETFRSFTRCSLPFAQLSPVP